MSQNRIDQKGRFLGLYPVCRLPEEGLTLDAPRVSQDQLGRRALVDRILAAKKADPAATWTIFICSIWPMILNTAEGVRRVPQDYLNVARVLGLREGTIIAKILFPAVLPYMLTGIRLSIGTAWLVIVAAEMLTGGVGIGFFIWDAWNSSRISDIIVALVYIGIVGFLLDKLIATVGHFVSHGTSTQ